VPEILKEVKVLEVQSQQIKCELTKLCWHMRGGLSYDEAYYLGPEEREVIAKLVEENFEITKKTQMPYF
jgi:hypothetical protein